jgi:hypothetical protein
MTARGLILPIFASALAALMLASSPALAIREHIPSPSSPSFGSGGHGNSEFSEPRGVAVGEVGGSNGNVYVVDSGNNRVEVFSSTGTYLSQFNGSAAPTGAFSSPQWIAVDNSVNPLDPSAGDVYVTDNGHKAIDKFSSSGTYIGQIIQGSGGGPFGELFGVAADAQGQVWAYQESGEIDDYSDALENQFLANRSSPFGTSSGFAVDAEDDLYVNRGAEVIAKLTSSGQILSEELDAERSTATAVDLSNGNAYVDNVGTIGGFSSSGAPLERFGSGILNEGSGLAVNASDKTVYAVDRSADAVKVFTEAVLPDAGTDAATGLQAEGLATLNGNVNPEGVPVTACEFEYGTDASYGASVPCAQTPAEIGTGTADVAVDAALTALTAGSRYHFRLVVRNAEGESLGEDQSFIATGRPTITEEAVSNVASTTATIGAQVNAGGTSTSYQAGYGTSAAYGSSTPEESVGAGLEATGVQFQLTGLQPGAIYHFRFFATNARGASEGVDVTFTTAQPSAASTSTLPDGRVYELVSPPNNQDVYVPSTGADREISTERLVRASADGDAVTYVGDPPAVGGNGATGNGLGNQFLAKRNSGGWTASVITPLASNLGVEYTGFSSDLSAGVVGVSRAERTRAGASVCDELLLHTSGDEAFHPLFATQAATSCGESRSFFAGASAENSHFLFESANALTSKARQSSQEGFGVTKYNLYDSVAGQLQLVNVLPDGEADPNATFGSPPLSERLNRPDFSNVISADGSRVFWTDLDKEITPEDLAGTTRLFARENDTQPQSPLGPKGECTVPEDACTVQLDIAEGGSGSSGGGRFLGASSDGSKVFFMDCSRLTPDSSAVTGEGGCVQGEGEAVVTGNDLYEYDFDKPLGERLTDLTVDTKDPLGADVQGLVAMSTANGGESYIYFVAGGALAPGATALTCQEARQRETSNEAEEEEKQQEIQEENEGLLPAGRGCNLYVLHIGEPARFIGTLAPKDNMFSGAADYETNGGSIYGDWHGDLGSRTAEATPDGRHLLFRSTMNLTGYDSFGSPELFVYDADTGLLSCASCEPNGGPPTEEGNSELGGFLPASLQGTYMLRWLSDDGSRVFFDTRESLVPQDSNGGLDVYEWERDGAGSCLQGGGCVFLLSGGTRPVDSYLIDAGANGNDVFLASRDQLAPQDPNESVALYDVRVDGGFAKAALACTGTGCQGVPPAPPIFATPSSATFSGVGNFEASSKVAVKPRSKPAKCKRGHVKKRGRCVKRKAKQVRKKARRSDGRSKRGRK